MAKLHLRSSSTVLSRLNTSIIVLAAPPKHRKQKQRVNVLVQRRTIVDMEIEKEPWKGEAMTFQEAQWQGLSLHIHFINGSFCLILPQREPKKGRDGQDQLARGEKTCWEHLQCQRYRRTSTWCCAASSSASPSRPDTDVHEGHQAQTALPWFLETDFSASFTIFKEAD